MNKKVISIILFILIFFLITMNSILANSKSFIEIKADNNILKAGEETTLVLKYIGTDARVNVIKGQIEYDNNIFEYIKEDNIKLLNGWTQIEYNEKTKEFIAIKKSDVKLNEDILQITLKAKENINDINETTIKFNNISMSNGTENIVEPEHTLLIGNSNRINMNMQENTGSNQDTKSNINSSLIKDTRTSKEKLPKAGTEEEYIFVAIVILTIIAIISKIKIFKLNKRNITNKITLVIAVIITSTAILMPFSSTKAAEKENAEIIKGQLNNDDVIDYEDVRILEKYLINKTTLTEKQIQNADINDDENINIIDLSLLIFKLEKNNGNLKIDENTGKKEYRETTSMYAWGDTTLVKDEEAQDVYNTLKKLNVTTLYQSMHRSKITKEYLADIIKGYHNQGIEVYRLSGDPSWVYDNSDAKGDIDEIVTYNATVDNDSKLVGINLDVEPHGNKAEWKENPQATFTQYIKSMTDIYNYAKKYDLQVTICINDWMTNYEGVEELFKNAADTYSVMNYVRKRMFNETKIGAEIQLAEKYNKKIESISNVMQSEPNSESYYNDGMNILLQDQEKLMNKYSYKNLRTSFHHYKPIKEVMNRDGN